MAGHSSSKRKCISYDIDFDGALLSTTRATLVIELIKYLMYERQQIPLSVDELTLFVNKSNVEKCDVSKLPEINGGLLCHQGEFKKLVKENTGYFQADLNSKNAFLTKDITHKTENEYSSSDVKQNQQDYDCADKQGKRIVNGFHRFHIEPSQISANNNSTFKMVSKVDNPLAPSAKNSKAQKSKNLIQDLNMTFDNLKKAFEECPEIEQVAVLLGGTILSPKESYLINFPPPCPDADCLPLKDCKTTLFKRIISEDFFGCLSIKLPPTSMMLLLSAPRSCPLQWFLPKMSFNAPKIGTVISLNFQCTYLVPIRHDLTLDDAEIELSGIEILDCSLCEKDNQNTVNELPVQKNTDSCEQSASSLCDLVKNSQNKSCSGNFFNRDVSSSHQSGDTTPCASRFCIHQRANYIYSHHKKRKQMPQRLTPDGSCSFHQSPVLGRSVTNTVEKDVIWYQSPLIIKGLACSDFLMQNH
ncbi:hypothetical protein Btru_065654 [Bulinus truncatus]|nr:hypothetical protein Btru_065654 [Bulinus truncatus]